MIEDLNFRCFRAKFRTKKSRKLPKTTIFQEKRPISKQVILKFIFSLERILWKMRNFRANKDISIFKTKSRFFRIITEIFLFICFFLPIKKMSLPFPCFQKFWPETIQFFREIWMCINYVVNFTDIKFLLQVRFESPR